MIGCAGWCLNDCLFVLVALRLGLVLCAWFCLSFRFLLLLFGCVGIVCCYCALILCVGVWVGFSLDGLSCGV